MYAALKFLHIAALAVWFAGLLTLPWIFGEHAAQSGKFGTTPLRRLERTLYFDIMSPAAVLTVVFGSLLMLYGFAGAWLPVKLTLLAGAVLFHLYCGRVMELFLQGDTPHGRFFFRALSQVPLALAIAIVMLATVKPF